MDRIHVLDSLTIDKIAAGEVVERPASVAKELVENAIDAGATEITVEIRGGGIDLLRVTDNGKGIEEEQVKLAFLRHATSKIDTARDLEDLSTLGFRGEALASISAVAMVEMITKREEDLTGTRYVIHGGKEQEFTQVGAPDGTSIIVKNLFFNTPPRLKFLKKPQTEGAYVADLMEHLALSRPDISVKFINSGQVRFFTSGNGKLSEVVYRLYGKEMAAGIREFSAENEMLGIRIRGVLGDPIINRSGRGFELFYVNGRFIRSKLLSKAVEEGYVGYVMQHRFPFCILFIDVNAGGVDVNVHPTKMEVRFSSEAEVYRFLVAAVSESLHREEMIQHMELEENKKDQKVPLMQKSTIPESFEKRRIEAQQSGSVKVEESASLAQSAPLKQGFTPVSSVATIRQVSSTESLMVKESTGYQTPTHEKEKETELRGSLRGGSSEVLFDDTGEKGQTVLTAIDTLIDEVLEETVAKNDQLQKTVPDKTQHTEAEKNPIIAENKQLNLFEEKILSTPSRARFRLIGQLFKTYWLVEFDQKLLIVDQHAAHEKVKYERLMKQLEQKEIPSQLLAPPVVISVSAKEEAVLLEQQDNLEALGFLIEAFGGREYALRSVPMDLYGCSEKELFYDILENMMQEKLPGATESVRSKLASMACKSAVKGNNLLSTAEMEALLDELLTLENPYHCPHGRPTLIQLSETELEKKFMRIV